MADARNWRENLGGEEPGSSFAPKRLALLAAVALVYCLAGKVGLRLAFVHPYITPIWISAGVAVAAFVLFGYRVWPAILLGGFVDHATALGLVMTTFTIPPTATLEGLAGAYLVNNLSHGVKAFDKARDVFWFVFAACVCAPVISATIGTGVDYARGALSWAEWGPRWVTWWLAYGIGTLLVAPFLILLLRAPHHGLDLRELGELTILLLGLIFLCLLIFGPLSMSLNQHRVVQVWVCVPFLIWAAFRFCPLEAAGTTLILFGSAIWGTLHGYGSFMAGNLRTSVVLLDSFIGVIGTTILVVAALVVEQRRIAEQLLGTQSLLQAAVEHKEKNLIVTVRALEVEATGHVQTKKALQQSQERIRRMASRTPLEE